MADQSCPPELRGTYLGLVHDHPGEVSSGLSHLTDLGVTAVHLLPIHDFPAKPGEYNWGYWTALFNVPESGYSTDPSDPTAPIRELKSAIQQLHAAGIRVILDVVYNHTSSSFADSAFDQAVPWYYFRSTPDGRLRNDAGVGNSIADERPMVRDYILDSLKFWLTEYQVDGFRFDLVGTHTPETVREVCDELTAIRPDITLYGEPWTGGGPLQFGKGAQRGLPFAVFNDHLRNAIRGDLDGTATGFATGPGGDTNAIRSGVAGAIDDFADEPTESINYVSAHDNRTLWDKLEYTHPNLDDATKRSMQKLSLGIVLTSQGVAFLHGGSDFCRTKGGNHNSYSAGDGVNKFDWWRKSQYLDVFHYVAALVQLRREHPAFRMPTAEGVRANLAFLPADDLVAFTLDGAAVGDEWSSILVAYNGDPGPRSLRLPEGSWTLVVDADHAGQDPLGQVRGRVDVPGYSMIVAYRP
ncbi:MAG: alpha-amylase family glycosyl hydrolase [Phycisphaerales bacterium]